MSGPDQNVAGIGALAEPVRRELYRYVCSQPEPVSRDQAAQAVQIARHQAKFHLDRLEAEGLLEADYARLTGRTGPGAGRPAKRYRRGRTEFAISIPPRDYELAGHIMADAIGESTRTGAPIQATLNEAADAQGAAIAAASAERPRSTAHAVALIVNLLSRNAYEPRRTGSDHLPYQLPVPGPGPQPQRAGLSDEPFPPHRTLPIPRTRPGRSPPSSPRKPLLRPTHGRPRVARREHDEQKQQTPNGSAPSAPRRLTVSVSGPLPHHSPVPQTRGFALKATPPAIRSCRQEQSGYSAGLDRIHYGGLGRHPSGPYEVAPLRKIIWSSNRISTLSDLATVDGSEKCSQSGCRLACASLTWACTVKLADVDDDRGQRQPIGRIRPRFVPRAGRFRRRPVPARRTANDTESEAMAPKRTQRITKMTSSSTTTWTWQAVGSWLGSRDGAPRVRRRCAYGRELCMARPCHRWIGSPADDTRPPNLPGHGDPS